MLHFVNKINNANELVCPIYVEYILFYKMYVVIVLHIFLWHLIQWNKS